MKRFSAVLLCLFLLFFGVRVSAAELERVPYDTYTYWQDDGTKILAGSRSMFEVERIITGEDLNTTNFEAPADIISDRQGGLYILDSGNSRIIRVDQNGAASAIPAPAGYALTGASGLAVSASGEIYVADTENMRVLVLTPSGALSRVITCPDIEIIPDDFEFRPLQLTLDESGYLYVLSKGSFYGALVFAPDGTPEGFFGATTVNASVGDIFDTIWSRWFMTDDQRAGQVQKIPYQFSDLSAGKSGLLYTTTGATTTFSTQYGQIRCLGPAGTNILKNRTGFRTVVASSFNFADDGLAQLAVGMRTQNFVSLDVQDGYIYALDQTYGKVFVYDESCELLTVFGGGVQKGEQIGTFKSAVALAVSGERLYVLDQVKNNITVFKRNDYGTLVQQAAALTGSGHYSEAGPLWEKVIKLDRNSQMAYRGLARAALADGDAKAAMNYARQGLDGGTYDRAFEEVRADFFERNIGWIIFAVVAVIAAAVAAVIAAKKGRLPRLVPASVKLALGTPFHPFDSYRAVKYAGAGSAVVATVVLVLYYISDVLCDYYSGFAFSDFSPETYNSLFALLGSVGVVLLWVISNWGVSVLADGKARMREVYLVACYCLVPQIFSNIFRLAATNVLLLDESAALSLVSTVCLILSGISLIIGTMIIQEFDFFKFLGTAILTLIAMALVIFLIFMVSILLQQFYAFLQTVFIEVVYR